MANEAASATYAESPEQYNARIFGELEAEWDEPPPAQAPLQPQGGQGAGKGPIPGVGKRKRKR